jgi:lysophospholipase L1-like esterase
MLLSMKKILGLVMLFGVVACTTPAAVPEHRTAINVFIASDSTATDQTLNEDYQTHRHPVTGWGQSFQPWISGDNLKQLSPLLHADSATLQNHAKGGRSTRTFFEEGRWQLIYDQLQPGDLVLIQFGHNDAAENKHERYVNIQGYKQFLRLYVDQVREKKAIPVLMTPVNRNYPWENGVLGNSHGDYPDAVKAIAAEKNALLIDLGQRSRDFFTSKGEAYVGPTYFMNLKPGDFPAYPNGHNDNTHFQPVGGEVVSKLVYEGLVDLAKTLP